MQGSHLALSGLSKGCLEHSTGELVTAARTVPGAFGPIEPDARCTFAALRLSTKGRTFGCLPFAVYGFCDYS